MVYYLYGVRLRSDWALPYSRAERPFVADVALTRRAPACFAAGRAEAMASPESPGRIHHLLADGRIYLQWPDQFEFLISADGHEIAGRALRAGTIEGFHTHLLGQALSFALIRLGLEPLHATAVTVNGASTAFLGESGYGKSSLAAAFVGAGHRLLTDDLLVLTDTPAGLTAQPGPPRLKLYPQTARRLMPGARGTPLMRTTPKLLLPLQGRQVASGPSRLRAMYVLVPPSSRSRETAVTIRRLGERQACVALIGNTFNASVRDRERLAQHFDLTARLAASVPVKSICYPRSFGVLPDVRDAILDDLAREASAAGAR